MRVLKNVFALMLLGLPMLVFSQKKPKSYIKNIEAKLFYNQDKWKGDNVAGTFSPNIIDTEEISLWNTIIGGGSAKGNSHQTFVTITIETNGSYTDQPQVLRLSSTANKKLLSQQSITVTCYGENESAVCSYCFVINDTGCDPLTLKAELIRGKQVQHTLTKAIDFHCGE